MTDLFSAPAPTTQPPSRSRSAQRRTRQVTAAARRRRRRRRTAVLLLALVVVAGAGWFVYDKVLPGVSSFHIGASAKDYPGPGTGTVQVRVEVGDSGTAIARTLSSAGVVASVKAFTDAYSANPAAAKIQPGLYTLRKEMKASDAVALLAANTGRVETTLTIPEGYTVDQILDRASTVTGIARSDFETAMKDTTATGLPSVAKKNYEGWLFPATYTFDPDVTASDIVKQMVAQTTKELKTLKVPASQQEEVLVKASIVEREVSRDEYRGKVARAIDNRLAAGQALEVDSTTAYGLGTPTVAPTKAQNHDPKNAYSTYEHVGLPPGPIASPGIASIKAVLDPPAGPWLFWVTVNLDTGETKFATTYAEQTKNIDELDAWKAANGR